jgi:hypothetical protein
MTVFGSDKVGDCSQPFRVIAHGEGFQSPGAAKQVRDRIQAEPTDFNA